MSVRVAVEGCCHGELKQIYARIKSLPIQKRPDILFICGDFQALRDESDYPYISMPQKYKKLGDFRHYYQGEEAAPVMTVFIGGNHEASNFMHELRYGGWVAPNIYYMGYSNVIWYRGLRIGGISGIFKLFDFYKRRQETVPLDVKHVGSVYHTRFEEYLKVSMIRNLNIDVFLSHDWPEGIYKFGDLSRLLRKKPFFSKDIQRGELGSPPNLKLLKRLKPNYWFSAHLHVRFEATVDHDDAVPKRKLSNSAHSAVKKPKNGDEIELDLDSNTSEIELNLESKNNDEIELDLEDFSTTNKIEPNVDSLDTENMNLAIDEPSNLEPPKEIAKGFNKTKFLSLDKCVPGRQYLEYIDIPLTNTDHPSCHDNENLYHDLEYLKITKWFKKFHQGEIYSSLKLDDINDEFIEQFVSDIHEVDLKFDSDLKVIKNFEPTIENPTFQTDQFLKRFNL